jgi:hypothetical protein
MMTNSEIKELFKYYEGNPEGLGDRQKELIKGMRKYYRRNKQLSERQIKVLIEIRAELTNPGN